MNWKMTKKALDEYRKDTEIYAIKINYKNNKWV